MKRTSEALICRVACGRPRRRRHCCVSVCWLRVVLGLRVWGAFQIGVLPHPQSGRPRPKLF
eukprot:1930529-Prymnesium_polylepis.1